MSYILDESMGTDSLTGISGISTPSPAKVSTPANSRAVLDALTTLHTSPASKSSLYTSPVAAISPKWKAAARAASFLADAASLLWAEWLNAFPIDAITATLKDPLRLAGVARALENASSALSAAHEFGESALADGAGDDVAHVAVSHARTAATAVTALVEAGEAEGLSFMTRAQNIWLDERAGIRALTVVLGGLKTAADAARSADALKRAEETEDD